MASNSKDANKGVEGVALSKKGSKSKGSSKAAAGGTGAMVERGHPPSEGRRDSIKLSRNVILKFPSSRKSKPKDIEDSMASQATKALLGGDGIARPSFSSK